MATFRTTFFFAGWDQGWSESWYVNPATNMLIAMTKICGQFPGITPGSIADARKNLLAPGVTLDAVRINDVTTRASLLNYIGQGPGNDKTVAPGNMTPAWNGMLVSCFGVNGAHRAMFLRGVKADWIQFTQGGQPVPPPADFVTLFNRWRDAVAAVNGGPPLAIRAIDKTRAPTFKFAITGLATAALGTSTLVTAPGFSPAVNSVVRIKRVKGLNVNPAINAVWPVLAGGVPGVSFVVAAPFNAVVPQLYQGLGYTYAMGTTYDTIGTFRFDRFDSRKTGAPFFVPHGRRLARR